MLFRSTSLFNDFGFDRVIAVIKHATILCQGWEDPTLFPKLKNILDLHNIKKTFLYASNIVSVINEEDSNQVLDNIETFNPTMSIHTDYCSSHHLPHRTFNLTNNNARFVESTLFEQEVKAYLRSRK